MSSLLVKPAPKFSMTPSPAAGLLVARFGFNRELQDAINVYPGVRYAPDLGVGKHWCVPIELAPQVQAIAVSFGYAVQVELPPVTEYVGPSPRLDLHPYQRDAAIRGICQPLMLALDPGLGKTVTALETLALAHCKHPLVVGPAIARQVWADQAHDWGYKQWRPVVIETGAQAAQYTPGLGKMAITSYELAGKIAALEGEPYDAVIVDESHALKNSLSKRSRMIRDVVDLHSPRVLLLLTGTPIANEPADLWAQLDLLYPERFGTFHTFRVRYCQAEENEHSPSGFDYRGLNPNTAPELADRLRSACVRVTTQEVSSLLPPLTTQVIRIKPKRKYATRDLLECFDAQRLHQNKTEAHLLRDQDNRISAAEQWAHTALEQTSHILIFTYFKATAKTLAAKLNGVLITGEQPPKERHTLIKQAKQRSSCVIVATMSSAGEAIDLTFNRQALFAELYATPKTIVQALRRVYRLTSTKHVFVSFLAVRGSLDDVIVRTLRERLGFVRALYKVSDADEAIEGALQEPKETEKQWLDRMREIAQDEQEDEYL